MKVIFEYFYKISQEFSSSLKSDKHNKYFTWRSTYFFIIYRSILLRIINVSDKIKRNSKHFLCSITSFFQKSCHLSDNVEKYCKPRYNMMKIRRMHIECWIPKATNTHSEYVIHIAFPLQLWLHERTSMSRYTYIACLVIFMILQRAEITLCWNWKRCRTVNSKVLDTGCVWGKMCIKLLCPYLFISWNNDPYFPKIFVKICRRYYNESFFFVIKLF